MPGDPGQQVTPYLGKGEQGQMRLEALKRIAADAGFEYGGEPSVSRWSQHLVDEMCSDDGIGYYAVLRRGSRQHYLVFLAQSPVRGPGRRVQVRTADDSVET